MKRDELLNKDQAETAEYDLTEREKLQLGAILNLFQQAQQAQDILYSNLVESVADRLELSNRAIEINMEAVLKEGVKVAKLVAKQA